MIKYETTSQEEREGEFYRIYKDYIRYMIANPLKLNISDDCKIAIYKSCNANENLRAYKYWFGVFKAYCQYLQIATPSMDDVDAFLKIFEGDLNE